MMRISVFLLMLCWLPVSLTFFDKSHIPITTCDKNLMSPIPWRTYCIEECGIRNVIGDKLDLFIYNRSDSGKVQLADCRKYKIRQTFTKTWTFSTFKGAIETEELMPNYAECESTWRDLCNSGPCSTTTPVIPEEYHWASDTTKEVIYVSIDAYQKTVAFQDPSGDIQLLVHGVIIDGSQSGYVQPSKDLITMWDKVELQDECPWSTGNSLSCSTSDEGISYYCAGKGLVLTNISTVTDTRCDNNPHLMTSGHHVIFRVKKASDPNATLSRTAQIVLDRGSEEAEIVDSVNKALLDRDSIRCASSCLAFDYTISKPQMFGNQLALPYKGSFLPCNILPNCRVVFPVKYCSSPPMILVECTGTMTWWNITGDYTIRPTYCHMNQSATKIKTSISFMTTNGRVLVNESGAYPVSREIGNTFQVGHVIEPSSMIEVTDPLNVRIDDTLVTPESHTISNITSVGDSLLDTMVETVKGIGRFISHEVRIVVFGVLTLFMLYLSFKYLFAKKKSRVPHPKVVYTKPTSEGPVIYDTEYTIESD
uniref:Glycoprotein n=1 Tax=Rice stripe mosaic virus TaxID=1931356 RepID=A0A3G6VA03_9RHAB|nr:glycoprotein [Rice stripe mosaic virus]